MARTETQLPPPPPTTVRWVRLMVGFGVSVAVGLAPLLGLIDVPGFQALLTLFPTVPWDTRKTIVPLAAFAMGVTATVVQFRAGERVSDTRLKVLFNRTLLGIIFAFVMLVVVHTMLVRQVRVAATGEEVSVLVGFYRPPSCTPCAVGMSDSECITDHLSFNPSRVESCWGDTNIRGAFLALGLTYLALMSAFGSLIGYVMRQKPTGSQASRH